MARRWSQDCVKNEVANRGSTDWFSSQLLIAVNASVINMGIEIPLRGDKRFHTCHVLVLPLTQRVPVTDWHTEWPIDWLTGRLNILPADAQLTDKLIDRSTDWLTVSLTARLSHWVTYWLQDWLTDQLTDRLPDQLVSLTVQLTYWLTEKWQTYWLIDSLSYPTDLTFNTGSRLHTTL
jgi:hypothetical protein